MIAFKPYALDERYIAVFNAALASDKKGLYLKYICETIDKCKELIIIGESERALSEFKWMIHNLRKEFHL